MLETMPAPSPTTDRLEEEIAQRVSVRIGILWDREADGVTFRGPDGWLRLEYGGGGFRCWNDRGPIGWTSSKPVLARWVVGSCGAGELERLQA